MDDGSEEQAQDQFVQHRDQLESEHERALARISALVAHRDEVEAENDRLRAQLAEAKAELKNTEENEERLVEANKPLLARAVRAERDLLKYGEHLRSCRIPFGTLDCSCGWSARYAELHR